MRLMMFASTDKLPQSFYHDTVFQTIYVFHYLHVHIDCLLSVLNQKGMTSVSMI